MGRPFYRVVGIECTAAGAKGLARCLPSLIEAALGVFPVRVVRAARARARPRGRRAHPVRESAPTCRCVAFLTIRQRFPNVGDAKHGRHTTLITSPSRPMGLLSPWCPNLEVS
ncbi:hypothetical protein GCM10009717_05620 [Agromyces allii]|uniref:Uncharacterized protein n=1 Tax=Agromyces allii TaxID=393607 RepID=A0ABP5BFK0_9MICO